MKKNYPSLTLTHLQKLCRKGEIRVDGHRVSATEPLTEGMEIKLPPYIVEYESATSSSSTQNGKNSAGVGAMSKSVTYTRDDIDGIINAIIYEDSEILVLNKPSGLATQGGTNITKHLDTLINTALPQFNGNLRLTHRIDKDTSGIVVIAKNYDSANKIATLFKERKIHKTYHALVYGNFDAKEHDGAIDTPIATQPTRAKAKLQPSRPSVSSRISMVSQSGAMSARTNLQRSKSENTATDDVEFKSAYTTYHVLDEAFGLLSLVELHPHTGRTHQLRIHLSGISHPIIGDFKYSSANEFATLRDALEIELPRKLYLHAYEIEIEGKPKIRAPYPEHFRRICKYLNF